MKVTCAAQVWDLITAKAGSKPSPVLVWGWGSQVTPTLGGGQGLTVGRGAPFILDNTQPSHLGLVEGSGMLLPSLVEEGILPEGPRSFLQPLGSGGVVGRHLSGVLRGACSCPSRVVLAQNHVSSSVESHPRTWRVAWGIQMGAGQLVATEQGH